MSTKRWLAGIAAVAAVLGGVLTAEIGGQSGVFTRMPDGRPNLNGIWQVVNTANWDLEDHQAKAGPPQLGVFGATPPGLGVVEGGEIPYKPEARARQQENFKNRFAEDPEIKCYMPGVPRATYLPYPFQIVQGNTKILIVYGFADANRIVHLDKAKPEPAPIDSWMGRSHGRWDGNTLIVEAAGFNGQAWLDRSGNHATDALKVVERYTPVGPDRIEYEATLEDPNVFTRPWKISMPIIRRPERNAQLIEFKCVEFAEELLYGHLRRK
jgi:hypothetical protein